MPFPTPWKDNYAIVAENTTKFYVELQRNYADRFPDETSLLAAAGVCDAAAYVFGERTVSADDIVEIAEAVIDKRSAVQLQRMEDKLQRIGAGKMPPGDLLLDKHSSPLTDFVAGLEVKLFAVESPRLSESDIVGAVVSKYETIAKVVAKTTDKYTSESQFASNVKALMESPDYAGLRARLGIV